VFSHLNISDPPGFDMYPRAGHKQQLDFTIILATCDINP